MAKGNGNTQIVEAVVIGGGPAGYVCAIRLAQLGKQTLLIEKGELGGVCLNRGCIPSKALIHAGATMERIRHAGELGISAGEPRLQMRKLQEWKSGVVKKLTGGVGQLLKANGCQVTQGEAKLTGPDRLEVRGPQGTHSVQFGACVIATGSRPAELPGFAVDQKTNLDSTGALDLIEVPKTLLCIGGGYIGLELGTFYSKVGTQVTVVEAGPTLLPGVDPELTQVVRKKLEKAGVAVHLSTTVKPGKRAGEVIFPDGKSKTFDKILVTVGRKPNTENLGLSAAGLSTDAKGFLSVDGSRRTASPRIYAIGDVTGQPLLAHKGSKEGIVAAEAIAGRKTVYDVVAMPAVIFTDPEIALVGMSEAEARAKGFEPVAGIFPFAANGRALSVSETDGFVKTLADRKSGRLLGVSIVGPEASNLVAEAALALEMGALVEDLALTVHAHPTLPEALMESAEAALGHAIHVFQRKPSTREAHA